MLRMLPVLVAVATLVAPPAAAQDVESVLQAAAEAMGDPAALNSIEYSGSGWVTNIGQSHTPNDDWPRFEVTDYTRTIDYGADSSNEAYTRSQGDFPALGGGTPLVGEQQRGVEARFGHIEITDEETLVQGFDIEQFNADVKAAERNLLGQNTVKGEGVVRACRNTQMDPRHKASPIRS